MPATALNQPDAGQSKSCEPSTNPRATALKWHYEDTLLATRKPMTEGGCGAG